MKLKRHSNVTFVTTVFLARATWLDMLHQFIREIAHDTSSISGFVLQSSQLKATGRVGGTQNRNSFFLIFSFFWFSFWISFGLIFGSVWQLRISTLLGKKTWISLACFYSVSDCWILKFSQHQDCPHLKPIMTILLIIKTLSFVEIWAIPAQDVWFLKVANLPHSIILKHSVSTPI